MTEFLNLYNMRYQIGDRVKYLSGDWIFYGIVTAIVENAICPSYRLVIDRMEKKSCKFSITQFEFELESDDVMGNANTISQWEKNENQFFQNLQTVKNQKLASQLITLAPAPSSEPASVPAASSESAFVPTPTPAQTPLSDSVSFPAVNPSSESAPVPAPNPLSEKKQRKKREPHPETIAAPQTIVAPQTIAAPEIIASPETIPAPKALLNTSAIDTLKDDKFSKPIEMDYPFEHLNKEKVTKKVNISQKRNQVWQDYLDKYQNGDQSASVYYWFVQVRRDYRKGNLRPDRLEKLLAINFPFEAKKERNNSSRKSKESTKLQELQESQELQVSQTPNVLNRDEEWDKKFELYKNGNKSRELNNWTSYIRKQYQEGSLSEERLIRLKAIEFPFKPQERKKKQEPFTPDARNNYMSEGWWDYKLSQWKKGDRDSMQQWRQKCIRLYINGKLPEDKIKKLKEMGILE